MVTETKTLLEKIRDLQIESAKKFDNTERTDDNHFTVGRLYGRWEVLDDVLKIIQEATK